MPKKPHILVITVESLSFEMASCLDELEENDGFSAFCQESLRFTHVFAPSTLSQSSLAGVLTGRLAKEHRVFHNGNQFVPPGIHTVAEQALQQGYQTLFLSGGPPILAKSGLSQGFEVFNDEFSVEGGLYRSAQQLFKSALNILKNSGDDSQFITLFLADLQFPFVVTKSDTGREREKTISAQRLEVGESLKWFVEELRREKLWDDAYIFLMGLNGAPDRVRKGVLWRDNLFRENIHVPVFIKLPKSDVITSTDLVDRLMGLEDVGHILNQVVTTQIKTESSVKEWLSPNSPRESVEVRSDWAKWWFSRPPLISLRTYDYLIFPSDKLRVYNSIEDRGENEPLSAAQIGWQQLKWLNLQQPEIVEAREVAPKEYPDIYGVLKKIHWNRYSKGAAPGEEIGAQKDNPISVAIRNDQMLWQKNWPELLRQTEKGSLLYFVASTGVGTRSELFVAQPCEVYFKSSKKRRAVARCEDPLFLSLLDWERALEESEDIAIAEKKFIRKLRSYLTYKRFAYANLTNELNWDIDYQKYLGPSYTELYLHLPSKIHLRKKVEGYKISLNGDLI